MHPIASKMHVYGMRILLVMIVSYTVVFTFSLKSSKYLGTRMVLNGIQSFVLNGIQIWYPRICCIVFVVFDTPCPIGLSHTVAMHLKTKIFVFYVVRVAIIYRHSVSKTNYFEKSINSYLETKSNFMTSLDAIVSQFQSTDAHK